MASPVPPEQCHLSRSRLYKALSLLELLVALIIVAVLSSLTLGGVLRIRDSARKAVCVSNLRTYAQAILNDAADQQQTFMAPGYEKGVLSNLWNYRLNAKQYIPFDAQRTIYCPALHNSSIIFIGLPESEWVAAGYLNSVGYAYNMWLAGKRQAQISNPAKTMLMAETNLGSPVAYGKMPTAGYAFRHHSAMNLIYCDGHISQWEKETPLPPVDDPFWAYPPLP